MKLKKFFAGVLAAAMMLTVGATAAFATAPDKISVPGADGNAKMFTTSDATLQLTKELKVESGTAPSKMTFNFEVKSGTAVVDEPSVTFEPSEEEGSFAATKTYTRTFGIDLEKLLGTNKTQVGTYEYTITEKNTTIPGITKDPKTVKMTVTVVNKASENLSATTGYGYYVALRDGESSDKTNGKFTNTYNAYNLEVKKTVQGNFGDLGDDFTFTVSLNKITGKDDNYATVTVTSDNAANNGKTLSVGDSMNITLKHGEKATFSNLPEGVTYTVSENDSAWTTTESGNVATKGQYTVTLENGTLTGEKAPEATGTISTANAFVGFINTHEGTPDMGVVLDNAPYIAMLAIVAIGGVALMLNKRRRDEE